MKKYLLSILSFITIISSPLIAYDVSDLNFFFSGSAGINFIEIEERNGIEITFDPGIVAMCAMGFPMNNWISAETEMSIRHNKFRSIKNAGEKFNVDGDLTKLSLMENFTLTLTQRRYCPFMGFGVGLKKDSGVIDMLIINPDEVIEVKEKIDAAGTAFQLFGGIDIPFSEKGRLKMQYKCYCTEGDEVNHSVIISGQKSF